MWDSASLKASVSNLMEKGRGLPNPTTKKCRRIREAIRCPKGPQRFRFDRGYGANIGHVCDSHAGVQGYRNAKGMGEHHRGGQQ